MVLRELKPSEILYSQDSILNRFGKKTDHADMYIGKTLDDLLEGRCNVADIHIMNVMNRNGKWFTSDNRRLWVFRTAEEIGFLETVKVNEIYYIYNKKFTTRNHGQSVIVRGGDPGGRIWKNWKPQRPISNTVRSYQPSYYLNRSDSSSGKTFSRTYTTIKDIISYSDNQNRSVSHLSFHSNDGVIVVGDLNTKTQVCTDHLSPQKSKYQDKKSSDIKSTEIADYDSADDVQSYKPSVISDRQTSHDQSSEHRNNLGDVKSYKSSVMSDREASFDQSRENRNNLGDVQSYKSSVLSDRQTSFDQSSENRNNAGVEHISDRHETLGSTFSLRHKKEEDGCCCVIL